MKLTLSLSKTQIKRRATDAFFERTSAQSHGEGDNAPLAVIMAGVPGSGKTEFIHSLLEQIPLLAEDALRIDLDEIVQVFEEYTPQQDYKFRNVGNAIIESILDRAIHERYNFILDGTFAGTAAVRNIERLIGKGYQVTLFLMIEDLEHAKEYTRIREKKTARGVDDEAFGIAARGIRRNLQKLLRLGLPVDIVPIKKNWQSDVLSYSIEPKESIDILYEN